VCELLTRHGQIDATDVEVRVENAEVTLVGSVDSRQAKRLAEDVAESASGVLEVHNQLRVGRGQAPGGPGGSTGAAGQAGPASPPGPQQGAGESRRGRAA
jgi:hypothetical protein